MLTLILFLILAAWMFYGLKKSTAYVDTYGFSFWGALVEFVLTPPLDLLTWLRSKAPKP